MKSRQTGFSIIGPLVVTAVIAVTVTGLVRGLPLLTGGVCQARWRTLATVAAQNKLEELKWRGAAWSGRRDFNLPSGLTADMPECRGYCEVYDADGLRQVLVGIVWQTKRGEQEVVLGTLVE